MAHLYVFDQEEQLLTILSEEEFEEDEHKRQLNGSWTFTFMTGSKYAPVLLKGHKIAFYDREKSFRLFIISEVPTVTYHDDQIEVYAVNDYFQLAHQIVEDRRLREGTAREALSKVLDGSGYLVGEVADLGNQTISFYDVTRMEGLEIIVETYRGEIDFRIELDEEKRCISKKFIDLKARLGTDTGLRFTFDSNLEEVKRSDTSEGHFTVLYGRGKGIESGDGYSRKIKFTAVEWTTPIHPVDKPIGQSFIEDKEAIAKYGRIEGIYENSDIEDPGELLQATYEALQQVKHPILSYEVKAKDLAQQAGYEHFKLTLGDSVILLDETYQLSLESRIVAISESIRESETEQYLTLGSVQPSLTDSMGNAQVIAPSESETIVIEDENFPDTLPAIPQLQAEGLFSSILVEWTYEAKSYYEYEIYASSLENFNPDLSNLIFRGKASTLLHQVKPQETWYYRARARNTHGKVTEWSSQVRATSTKIADGAEYFETAAISDAQIGALRLDRGWVGKLTGDLIEAKNLVVIDGNGKKTLHIDSFGRVFLDVYELNIQSQEVMTRPQVDQVIHEAVEDLDSSYAVSLTNEAQTIPTTSSRVPTANATYVTEINIYQGTKERTDYTIGHVASANGITVTQTDSSVKFTVSTKTALTVDSGSFSIPITIDGRTFTKTFSWSCAKQGIQGPTGATGPDGQDGYTVLLTNENHAFPASNTGNISSVMTITTQAIAYKGSQLISATFGTLPALTGLTLSASGNTLTIKANTGTSLADTGTINLPVIADGKTFTKVFSWTKTKQGSTGATGPQGPAGTNSKSVAIVATSQVFKSTDGGLTFTPDTIKLTPILQNVTYSNWQYSLNGGSSWHSVSSGSQGLTISGGVLTITKDCSLFTATVTAVSFRMNTNDSSIYDVMTVVKLYDVTELDFGGRNILKYSNIKSNTGWTSNSHVIFSESGGYERSGCITVTRSDYIGTSRTGPSNSNVTKQGIIPQGTQLTLSGWVMIHSGEGIPELDVNNTSLFYRAYYADGSGSFQDVVNLQLTMTMEKNKWMRISGTGTAKVDLAYNGVDGVSKSQVGFYLGKNGKVSVSNIKLELGNVLSDYTEAPEDFESIIDAVNSELKQEITHSVAGLQDQNNELIERVDEAFNDNVLSSYEKIQLQSDLRTIDHQYESMKNMVNEFNDNVVNGQLTALTLRHQELHAFVDPLLADLNTASEASNATIREKLYQYQLQYNITYVALQTMIENKLTTLTTTVNTTAQGVETAITKSNTALDGVQTIGKHFNFTDSGWVEIFATLNGVPGRFKTQITDQRLAFLDNNVEVAYMSNQKLYITQAQILNSLQLGTIEQSKTAKGGLIYQWKG